MYYNAQIDQNIARTEDSRKIFNPFPELVHGNILGVNKAISSALDVTMASLHARLPGEIPRTAPPSAPPVHPSLDQAASAAAHTVQFSHTPMAASGAKTPAAPVASAGSFASYYFLSICVPLANLIVFVL